MNKRIKFQKMLLIASICLATVSITKAQTEDKRWSVGVHAGFTQYNGDLGNDFYKTDFGINELDFMEGFTVSRYLTSHLDLSFMASKGKVGYKRANGAFSSGFTTALLNLRFNITGQKSIIRPYLFIGTGAMLYDNNIVITNKKLDYVTPSFGGGLRLKVTSDIAFNFQETFLVTSADDKDGVIGGINDYYLFHTAGFSYNFGKKKDADNDGVSDRYDKCPNTPANVAVDKTGCPLDKDKDGIADYLDGCPDKAGTVATNGCPDKDGDGIADKDDKCPDVFGLASFKGCPDTDGDGIVDNEDRCPLIAGPVSLKGCPDTDGDGVANIDDICGNTPKGYQVDATGCSLDNDKDGIVNEEDRCPNLAGPAGLRGCPDTDGDGVADIDDRCPNAVGPLTNKGCPVITKETLQRITLIGSKVFFENNSDQLKVASLVQLDELSVILKKYETANLVIEGYTDSNGDDATNLTLSQKRTESVKNYLIGKGITDTRLTATGFGENKPIASNKTSLGRAKNRRVELKTFY
jgi:outer membrane protein OmpA-like peptidoglycan-associated protein